MDKTMRKGSHTVTRLTCHMVWVTKYRDLVLKGDVQHRCRDLIIQICDVEEVRILKGVVSKDHVHSHFGVGLSVQRKTPALSVSVQGGLVM